MNESEMKVELKVEPDGGKKPTPNNKIKNLPSKNNSIKNDAIIKNKSTTPQNDIEHVNNNQLIICTCPVESLLNFHFKFRPLDEKITIVNSHKPTPYLHITKKKKNCIKYFRTNIYEEVFWICGSSALNRLFCWPCLLFSKVKNCWNSGGFVDLNNLSKAWKLHESKLNHIDSCVEFKRFERLHSIGIASNMLNEEYIKNHNKKVTENKHIVTKYIEIVSFILKSELSQNHIDKYKFVDLLKLASKMDSKLRNHHEQPENFLNIHNDIQKDLIISINEIINEEIKREIKVSNFVSIIIEEVGGKSWNVVAIIFRFVSENGEVVERFVGLANIKTKNTIDSLLNLISKYVKEYDCSKKLVSYSYDCSLVKPGNHEIFKKEMNLTYPQCMFVQNFDRGFDIIFRQTLKNIKECNEFFQVLDAFYIFFSESSKRKNALEKEIKLKLHWDHNINILSLLYEYKIEIKNLLFQMINKIDEWDPYTKIAAIGLHIHFASFDFSFLLWALNDILSSCIVLRNKLQMNYFSTTTWSYEINVFRKCLYDKRSMFDIYKKNLTNDEIQNRIFSTKQIKLDDLDVKKYDELFTTTIDILLLIIDERYSLENLSFISLLDISENDMKWNSACNERFRHLNNFLDVPFDIQKLQNEFSYICMSSYNKCKSLIELKKQLLVNDNTVIFKEVYNFINFVESLPITDKVLHNSSSIIMDLKRCMRNVSKEDHLRESQLIYFNKKLLCKLEEAKNFPNKIMEKLPFKKYQNEFKYL